MCRGARGCPWLIHWEGLAVSPGMGVGGVWRWQQPWRICSWPKYTQNSSTYFSSHSNPLPLAFSSSSATKFPDTMASYPPSLLVTLQCTVRCLRPCDLQERRRGVGRMRIWREGGRGKIKGEGVGVNCQWQAFTVKDTVSRLKCSISVLRREGLTGKYTSIGYMQRHGLGLGNVVVGQIYVCTTLYIHWSATT